MISEDTTPTAEGSDDPPWDGRVISELGAAGVRFVRPLIHDLRSPLPTARKLIEELRDGQLTAPERHRLLDQLAAFVDSIDEASMRVFALERLEEELAAASAARFDVAEVVLAAVRVADLADDVEVHTRGPHRIIGYEGAVEQAVLQMLANAVDHTPLGTPIDVRVVADRRAVMVVVEDGGPGVPDEMKERIFFPFEHGDGWGRGGLGLGLALVARTAEVHGGQAWVEDGPGGGASFRMALPRRTRGRRATDVPEL